MIKKCDIKNPWATRINFIPRLWDEDNLTKKKTKENNEIYFLKQTTLKDVIGKENNNNLC
jgi:hypothetical protein